MPWSLFILGIFRVGYDDQIFKRQRYGGISNYFNALAVGLPSRAVDVSSFSTPFFRLSARLTPANLQIIHPTFYGGFPYRLGPGQSLVSTLFDMTPERFPDQFFLPQFRSPHSNKLAWLKASNSIISISAASADDFSFYVSEFPVPISIIHLATNIQHLAPVAPLVLNQPFFLMVGKRHAYKNGLLLLRAYALLRAKTKKTSSLPLLIFAGGGPLNQTEKKFIYDNDLNNLIIALEVFDSNLAWLYLNSLAVLIPSFSEGFSLPVIEALVCNASLIVSDIEVHREIAADFATFISPFNTALWAEAIASAAIAEPQKPQQSISIMRYQQLFSYYSLPRMLDQHLDFYTACLKPI